MRTLKLALLVDSEEEELLRSQRILEDAGFVVFATRSFTDAQSFLLSASPDIVVADVRLGQYNGLHLAAYSAFHRPSTRFVITHHLRDPVLAADAERLLATYVVKTDSREELRETAERLAAELNKAPAAVRRWQRKQAPAGTVAAIAAANAGVVDVSYGGVRLELHREHGPELPRRLDLQFPDLGLSLTGHRVWTGPEDASGIRTCGVAFDDGDDNSLGRWREFVDSVN
jgi:DNA-binding response OmpR family regulator